MLLPLLNGVGISQSLMCCQFVAFGCDLALGVPWFFSVARAVYRFFLMTVDALNNALLIILRVEHIVCAYVP